MTSDQDSFAGWSHYTYNAVGAARSERLSDYVQVGAHSKLVLTSAASFSTWIYPTGAGSDATQLGYLLKTSPAS
jgi:hypothetical protein